MRYEFGPFQLDAETLVLCCKGEPVPITNKVVQTLRVLVENAGRVVGKDEILTFVWSGVSVEEANLTQSIYALRRILGEKPQDHRFIVTVPGLGYRFVAEVRLCDAPVNSEKASLLNGRSPEAARPAPEPISGANPEDVIPKSDPVDTEALRRPGLYYLNLASLAVLLLGILGYFAFQKTAEPRLYASTPFTSYRGSQITPSFAPDGERIAFAWNSEDEGNFDIYVKRMGSEALFRLTTSPEPDLSPAWSPDGNSIAFLRVMGEGKADILLMSSIAPGPIRKLATIGVPLPTEDLHIHLTFIAWSPDGRWIAVSDGEATGGLVLFSVETGEYRRMTFPPSDGGDFSPAFSPNMDRLAFIRFSGSIAGDLYSLKLSRDAEALGEPERLTFYNRQITSPVWTKDGRALLFVRHEVAGTPSFWRVQMGGKHGIEALPIPADSSFTLTLSPRGNKLVYTRDSETVNIWAAELDRQHQVRAMRLQIASTWAAGNPQFSPDGRRIAYQSLQSGRLEIWVCDRDGSHPRQLTQLRSAVSGFARWSPDGKKIVFHSRPKSLASLYLIDADGGKPQRITGESGNETTPSWSNDGKWIYFTSTRAGQQEIWRMPAAGGAATKITDQNGWCPLESRDGQSLYYMSTSSGSTLRALPLSGGPERELLSGVSGRGTAYAPAKDGIYFIRTVDHDRSRELVFFDFASQIISVLAKIEKPVWLGLAISPEENLLLYSQVDRQVSNLMLVENFH